MGTKVIDEDVENIRRELIKGSSYARSLNDYLVHKRFDGSLSKELIEETAAEFIEEWFDTEAEIELVRLDNNDWEIIDVRKPHITSAVECLMYTHEECNKSIVGDLLCGCLSKEAAMKAIEIFKLYSEVTQEFDVKRNKKGDWVVIKANKHGDR